MAWAFKYKIKVKLLIQILRKCTLWLLAANAQTALAAETISAVSPVRRPADNVSKRSARIVEIA